MEEFNFIDEVTQELKNKDMNIVVWCLKIKKYIP